MKALWPFLLSLSFSCCFAATDSALVAQAKWKVKKLSPGIFLKTISFKDSTLFRSNQNISILEIKQKKKVDFDLAAEARQKKTTSGFGLAANAIAAINGTFFDVARGGSVDYLRLNGQVLNENRKEENNERARHQQAAVVIRKGKLSLSSWDGSQEWEKHLQGEDIMVSGPMLLLGSREIPQDSSSFSLTRHPRSVIATGRNNRVLLITIDGRHANAAGMSLQETAKIVRWMRYKDAINLDGGGSTTLWIRNEPDNGVVNYPSDNKKWDHEGEREVANVVLVKKR